jgi:hypothetical protein
LERKRAACDGVVTNSGPTQAVDELERLLDSWLDEQNTTHSPPGGVEMVRTESGLRHAP